MGQPMVTDEGCRTVVDRVKFWGETDPETPAFIFWGAAGRRVLTRWDVLDLSSRFAYRLKEIGISPGDVVCVVLPNSPERVVINFGITLAGAVSMNGQPLRDDGQDLVETLGAASCKALIINPDHHQSLLQIFGMDTSMKKITHAIASEIVPHLQTIIFCRRDTSLHDFLDSLKAYSSWTFNQWNPTDICAVFTTSGSSGYCKLVPHTHETILAAGYTRSRLLHLSPGRRFFSIAPLGWFGGYPTTYLFSGCTRVIIDEFHGQILNKISLMRDCICKEQVESAQLVPSLAFALKDEMDKRGEKSNIKVIMTAGQPVKNKFLKNIKHLAESICIAYGCTEAGLASAVSVDLSFPDSYEDYDVGYPLGDVKIKLVGSDVNSVPTGTRGEILVSSPNLSHGYIGNDDPLLCDGWFRTGDTGYMSEDGRLFAEGRGSDSIIHGSYIVYPAWLEKKLLKCPGIVDVAVVPIPDEVLHHEICACVISDSSHTLTEALVIEFCRRDTSSEMAPEMKVVPKYVLFYNDFPLTSTLKLDRNKLRKLSQDKLS